MIIVMYGIIVFQLVERIVMIKTSLKEALMYGADMLGLSYPALCTRHEVPEKPYLQEEYNLIDAISPQNYQTLRIWRIKVKVFSGIKIKLSAAI